ncbi:twin-arginine translocase TatA/TatE family subunit [uncultured Methanomethylovorans sp.]|uniref:twin-arginine translocase TatA/TatE family subunit n=1 Tax=uncultured Methanomethylovorans sp. TaxID=183759 RepID=UPI002AA662BE|nr:twin-arginine translocase TatA/TatE family subunit [uncultured Methanomethylovorans sp.]
MISAVELIVVLIAVLFIYGPDKIPEIAHATGKAYGEFKKAQLSAEFGLFDLDMKPKKNETEDIESKIREMARSSGIDVEGKSTDDLLNLIAESVKMKSDEAKNT